MEELVIEVNVNMSVELQILTFLVVPTELTILPKPLEIESVSHVDLTFQTMRLPLVVH